MDETPTTGTILAAHTVCAAILWGVAWLLRWDIGQYQMYELDLPSGLSGLYHIIFGMAIFFSVIAVVALIATIIDIFTGPSDPAARRQWERERLIAKQMREQSRNRKAYRKAHPENR